MGSIEMLIVFPVATLHLAIVPGGKRAYQLVPDAMLLEPGLEDGRLIRTAVRAETLGELLPIVSLDTFDRAREGQDKMLQEQGGGIGAALFKYFHKAPSGVLVNDGVLIEALSFGFTHEAGRGDVLHVNLNPLPGIVHLLIRLRDVLGIRKMDSYDALFPKETVKAWDRAGIAALQKLSPENDQTRFRIVSAHITNQLDFLEGYAGSDGCEGVWSVFGGTR